MTTEELKKSILQLAIQGKLVEQKPADEPASVLLERIRTEKQKLIKEGKIKRDKNESVIYRGDNGSFFERIGKEVRCIDDEIPFEIPDSWDWVRLGSISNLCGGYAFKSNLLGEKGTRVIRISDFDEFGFKSHKIVRYDYDSSLANYILGENNILMAMTGGTVGKSLFVPKPSEQMLVNQRVACIKLSDIIIPKYIDISLKSPFVAAIIKTAKNSTNDNISMGDIYNFLIALPPIAEQKRIVERLNDLEPLFAEYERLELQESKLEKNFFGDLNKSILQYAIQGKLATQNLADEPASVLLERIRAEKERLIKDKKIKRDKNESMIYRGDNGSFLERIGKEVRCIDDEIPFEIPDSWEWCRLSTIMSRVTSGSTPTGGKSVYTENGIKFIRSQNVHNDGLRLSNVAYISNIIHDSKQNSHVKANDLLLNITGASIGRCAIVPSNFDTANINQHILILRLINLELMLFVHLTITSPLVFQQIMTLQVGGTKEGLSAEKANRLLMPIPPLSEQKRIVEKLDQIKNTIKI